MNVTTALGVYFSIFGRIFGRGNKPKVQCNLMRQGDFYENLDDLAKKMAERDLDLRYVTSEGNVTTLAFIPKELDMPSSWYKLDKGADYSIKLKEVNRNTQNRADLWKISFTQDIFLYTDMRVPGKVGFARVEDGIIKGINASDFQKVVVK